VALKISGSPDGEAIAGRMKTAIEAAIEGAEARVTPVSPGHFEVEVTAAAFEGKSPVQQHQLVYGAIGEFMAGEAPPVHAIDRMQTRTS